MNQPQNMYLDYAAATPLDEVVLQVMLPYLTDKFQNPSALYADASAVRKDLEAARAKVAHWLGAKPSEIIFTAGGTEANNLAIHGIMRQYPYASIVVSAVEHEAVLAPAARYPYRLAPVDREGRVNVDELKKLVDDDTVLVSVMYANNEVGTIQPIKEIGQLLQIIRRDRRERGIELPLYLHTDACQAGNYLDLHAARLGVDLMTLNGGKVYGPKQSGALFVASHVRLQPLIDGGGQERGLRSGTENVAAAVGFAQALEIAQTMRHDETKRLQELQDFFINELESHFPGCVVNGSRRHRLPNNVHVTFPGQDNERLLVELDLAGIQAAAGSACSASNDEPSHVLRAMGLSDSEAQSSLRFSLGRGTSREQLERVIQVLAQNIA